MSRIYVATSWKNLHQPEIVRELRRDGHEVYDFRHPFHGNDGFKWSDVGLNPEHCTAENTRTVLQTNPIAARGFMSDLRAMQWADVCVLALPCGRSAHLEAGWFAGQGKRCVILMQDGEPPELMSLLATDLCISLHEVRHTLRQRI